MLKKSKKPEDVNGAVHDKITEQKPPTPVPRPETNSEQTVIGENISIEGEIKAQNVKISGQMIGNIKTQGKVEITKEADFMGDIRSKSISVEDGAYFKGSIELDKEPHKKTALTGKSTTVTATKPENKPETQTAKNEAKEI